MPWLVAPTVGTPPIWTRVLGTIHWPVIEAGATPGKRS
jgi:hypothetical protein